VSLETSETANEFARALDSLKSQNATGLVIDLRNNPGGLFPDPVLDISAL
jgi:C-terminal processing protease CtpA/Prc